MIDLDKADEQVAGFKDNQEGSKPVIILVITTTMNLSRLRDQNYFNQVNVGNFVKSEKTHTLNLKI